MLGWSAPLTFVRPADSSDWITFREKLGYDINAPLSWEERFFQLSVDSRGYLLVMQDFPGRFWKDIGRVNRPGYMVAGNIVCRTVSGIVRLPFRGINGFFQPCIYSVTWATAFLLNWTIYVSAVLGFYHLLNYWQFSGTIALLSAMHLAMARFFTWRLATISSSLPVIALAVAVMWIVSIIYKKAKTLNGDYWAILPGLWLGGMAWVKPQYDILAVGWSVLLYFRYWRAVIGSFVMHIVFVGTWIAIVIYGFSLPYVNFEVTQYRSGLWLFDDFIHWSWLEQLVYMIDYTKLYISIAHTSYGVVILGAFVIGIIVFIMQKRWRWLAFVTVAIVWNYLFIFAIRRYGDLYTGEIFYVIYPLSIWGISYLIQKAPAQWHNRLLGIYFVVAVFGNWALHPWRFEPVPLEQWYQLF
ncbi:MAG: hypothetical protein B6242_01915 [Anaerolineaceae bacterium 4572_78]|nr:MAG: hypothetical protein B6242_01915 [Anaerolineaceae bacterium 4572_78]